MPLSVVLIFREVPGLTVYPTWMPCCYAATTVSFMGQNFYSLP